MAEDCDVCDREDCGEVCLQCYRDMAARAAARKIELEQLLAFMGWLRTWHEDGPSWLRRLLSHCEDREAAVGKFLARFDDPDEPESLDLTAELDALRDDDPESTFEAFQECRRLADELERAVREDAT